jgi:hypothetical protein
MRAEPKTILRFLWENFEAIRDLFEIQLGDGIVKKEVLKAVCIKSNTALYNNLIEYKILRSIGDDFEFHSVYANLIEFIISEFKPLLPETIEKYNTSISQLYQKIMEGVDGDKNILKVRITELSAEIKAFSELVEKNTIGLLTETRNIKANVEKIDYREKIVRASRWINEYIVPLNTILDVNHSESIASKLHQVTQYVNVQRLGSEDENLRLRFEHLYQLLTITGDGLLKQSKVLTTELLPLIDRIRTESLILTGWIEFLKQPEDYEPPHLMRPYKDFAYTENIYLNTKEFFEQFSFENEVYLHEDEVRQKWLFNKAHFKEKLHQALPVNDFFEWCFETLQSGNEPVKTEHFFELISLIFEKEIKPVLPEGGNFTIIKTQDAVIRFPKITIEQHA